MEINKGRYYKALENRVVNNGAYEDVTEQLKPHTFPTWEEYLSWYLGDGVKTIRTMYDYFKSRTQPLEIGRDYEFQHLPEQGWYRKKLLGFKTTDSPLIWQSIRPIQADPIQDPIQNVIDILKSIREWSIGDNEYEALQDAIKILEESK
jgi:hypothetical protein